MSILRYGCTTWTLTKRMEKRFYVNYTKMLQAILNKSLRQHPSKQQLYGYLPPILKAIKVKRTKHEEHSWRSKDELKSDVFPLTSSQWWAKVGRPARTYIQQLCVDTRCSLEDITGAMDDRDGWRERVRDIRASCVASWWLLFIFFKVKKKSWRKQNKYINKFIYIYIYIYIYR